MTPIVATFLWLADKFGEDAIESGVQLGWDADRLPPTGDGRQSQRDRGAVALAGELDLGEQEIDRSLILRRFPDRISWRATLDCSIRRSCGYCDCVT